MAQSSHSPQLTQVSVATKEQIDSVEESLLLSPAKTYAGLQPPSSPFSPFQVFAADAFFRFPLLSDAEEDDTRPQSVDFLDSEEMRVKDCLERLQDDSPFRRGLAEAFPDDPSSPEQPAPDNSLQTSSASFESLSQYADPLHVSRDFFRDSLSRSGFSDMSDPPSRAEVSFNTREALRTIQRAFAAKQDERQLHSITPESSFFRDAKYSREFDPGFEVEEDVASFHGTNVFATEDTISDWEARPSLYRKSRASELSDEMSITDEGSAFRPPIFPTGPAPARGATVRFMPEIQEEDSSCSGQLSDERLRIPQHNPIPRAVFIPEKFLVSCATPASFATFADPRIHPGRDAYSPIVSKVAMFWRKGTREYELEGTVPCAGFAGAPALEFSNQLKKSKGRVSTTRSQLPPAFGLFASNPLSDLLKTEMSWVSCGFEHAVALSTMGQVFTWGYGASGALGHGDTNSVFRPKLVATLTELKVVYLESGAYHTAAVSDGGLLWTWGRGDMCQLGLRKSSMFKDDIGMVALRPQQVRYFSEKNIAVKAVACGEAHTVVIDISGEAYAFGWGAYGQLGIGAIDPRQAGIESITTIKGVGKVASIACGLLFSVCVTETGQVWVWGSGEAGQLGLGGTVKQTFSPLRVDTMMRENAIDVVCGEAHVIVLTRSGALFGWGTGLAGAFSDNRHAGFREGSEIICYVPQQLSRLDIVYHFSTPHCPHPGDPLALDLLSKLQQLQALDTSLASSL